MQLAFSKLQNNSCFLLYYSMMMLQLQAKFSVALHLSNPFIYSSCIEILMFISNISFRFNVWQQQVDITNNTYHNFWIHHDNIQISYMYYKTIPNRSTLVRYYMFPIMKFWKGKLEFTLSFFLQEPNKHCSKITLFLRFSSLCVLAFKEKTKDLSLGEKFPYTWWIENILIWYDVVYFFPRISIFIYKLSE